jgi:hypothetical protein
MARLRRVLAALSLLLVALSACGGGKGAPSARKTTPGRPASTASLAIISPARNAKLHGTKVHLKIELKGAKIVAFTSTTLTPNEGHLHVLLDGRLISMTASTDQDLTAPAGSHVVRVEFVANDHAPFNPRIIAESSFEVSA